MANITFTPVIYKSYRRKHPQMDAVFSTDDLEAIAKTLAKASEFVRKRLIRR